VITTASRRRWWRRRPPALVGDAVFGVIVTAVLLVGSLGEAHPVRPEDAAAGAPVPPTAAYLLVVVAGLALIWRRRRPLPVFVVSLAAVLAYSAFGYVNGSALLAPMVALYTVVAAGNLSRSLLTGGIALVSLTAVESTLGPFGPLGGPATVLPFEIAASVFLGLAVANRRAYVAEAEARAERAEHTREEEARRRVDAERLRIARELHDVVAHTMATINVQATAAAQLLTDRPAQAAEAVQAIRGASKQGLRELRAILNVLRHADEAESTQPAPGLAQLDALVATTSSAGLPTTVGVTGRRREVPPEVDLAAYRIVQESLTNAIRHAGEATAKIGLCFEDAQLTIDITDTGNGPQETVEGAGHGLAGMAERAASVGGTVDAGPGPRGGFRVQATLPIRGDA
jgi:signal transduction histidine kinase